jgi:hypothetical protein
VKDRSINDVERAALEQLKFVLGFFPRTDTMIATVLGVDLGMMAVLASHLPPVLAMTRLTLTALIPAILCAGSLVELYRAAFPRLDGGRASLVYFGEIADRTEGAFVTAFLEQKEEAYARDLLEQTWRNAQILVGKYRSLKKSFHWLAAAVFPWILVLAILSIAPVP